MSKSPMIVITDLPDWWGACMRGPVIDATPDEVEVLLDLGNAFGTHVAVAHAARLALHEEGPYHRGPYDRADLRAAVYGNPYNTGGYHAGSVVPA